MHRAAQVEDIEPVARLQIRVEDVPVAEADLIPFAEQYSTFAPVI
jgi:hypothetical protein